MYARAQQLAADTVSALGTPRPPEELIAILNGQSPGNEFYLIARSGIVPFRIGVDNMIASGFEMGYAAAVDDRKPARALGGPSEASVRRKAVKPKK
jgi:hypothetical protein